MMKIAVVGAGNVGSTLGLGWAKKGHQVVFGVRAPESQEIKALLAQNPEISAHSVEDAIAISEVIALAIPYEAAKKTVASSDLNGKIVLDCTNPMDGLRLTVGHTTSGAEEIAKLSQGAPVVKSFNMPGWENFADSSYPGYNGLKPIMYVCGDDDAANQKVCQLAEDLGFESYNWGPLEGARYLEPMAMVWIVPVRGGGRSPDFTFALLRRN